MNKYLKLDLQHFGDKTLYELKQNLDTVGQQLRKVEGDLSQKAVDPTVSMEDIQKLQQSKTDLKQRFDVIKEQHDQMEAEQKAKFAQDKKAKKQSFGGLDDKAKQVRAKAEFIRASVTGKPMSEDVKQLIAIPEGNESGGDKFLPTNMQKELVHEPFEKNQFRTSAKTTAIKGLEVPKIAYSIDDDDFIDDDQTAKEIELKGDTATFGRNKFKVKVKLSDTVVHGSDVELVSYVENALRSGLAGKEKKDALAEEPKSGLGHMSFYNRNDVKRVTGEDLYEAITNSIADLHEAYRDNAKVYMRFTDYLKIVKTLANGNASLFDAPPEKVIGYPTEFVDGAVDPIVGNFDFFQINYDALVYDSDKDVDKGNYIFVLTAWYDQQRLLDTAFRIAKVAEQPTP